MPKRDVHYDDHTGGPCTSKKDLSAEIVKELILEKR
jgi:hypothetical protein